jgi:hypothetical protein
VWIVDGLRAVVIMGYCTDIVADRCPSLLLARREGSEDGEGASSR